MEELREKLSEEDIKGEFDLEDFLRAHKIPVFLGLIGLFFLIAGIFFILRVSQTEDKIEIISSEKIQIDKTVSADIEGAIQKPGVYGLSSGARIEDLLIAAGGLSAEADREWVEKTLNRAQKLTDGAKIYIPKEGETVKGTTSSTSTTSTTHSASSGQAVIEGQPSLVNINTASQGELEALWGIGPVTAQKIIESRPYQTSEDLLTKKILKSNVYQRIVDQLTVY